MYRIESNSQIFQALVISPHILVKVMRGYKAGTSMLDRWQDVEGEFKQVYDTATDDKMPHISTWHNHLVLSEHAKQMLVVELAPVGEFLPVKVGTELYWVFNILEAVEADPEHSAAVIKDGLQVSIESLVFPVQENYPLVFKTPFDRFTRIFCDSSFKEILQDRGLEGLKFTASLV